MLFLSEENAVDLHTTKAVELTVIHPHVDMVTKDLSDSLRHAKRIHNAVLSDTRKLADVSLQHFIFNCPKNIVSGDFYWCENIGNDSIVIIGDSSGHGVPGAFISVVGIMLINLIVKERKITSPDKILAQLDHEIRNTLGQYKEGAELPDGIDIAVLKINRETGHLSFAGANHNIFLASNGMLHEIKGDRHSVGGLFNNSKTNFTTHEVETTTGDFIYMTTDGFRDQFGGIRNRKFSSLRFKELIATLIEIPFGNQRKEIMRSFSSWKGNNEQTDDVLFLGIMI